MILLISVEHGVYLSLAAIGGIVVACRAPLREWWQKHQTKRRLRRLCRRPQ